MEGKMESTLTDIESSDDGLLLNQENHQALSTQECKNRLGKYGLSDKRIESIRNNLIGILDSIINSYVEEFK